MKNGISHYLINRICSHAKWYKKTNQIIDDFEHDFLNKIQETIFEICYFCIEDNLKNGSTVVILSNDNSSNQKSWRENIILPIMSFIDDNTDGILNIDEYFLSIDETIVQDKNNIKRCIDNIKADAKKSIEKIQLEKSIIDDLMEKLVLILRFYYASCYIFDDKLQNFIQHLAKNPLFGDIKSDKPIIFYQKNHQLFLWLNRNFKAENLLLKGINDICQTPIAPLSIITNPNLNALQAHAVQTVSNHALSIITGGPGTGKTFTVAQIVMALYRTGAVQNMALVAPTGKAAQRMKESLQVSLQDFLDTLSVHLPEPMTIHRLLGIGKAAVPRYHQNNPLPYELIIVDEASMLGVELASWLVLAVKRGARLILLGDAHQLSSVDAGAVLSDLCCLPNLKNYQTHLTESRRFHDSSSVGKLAKQINLPEKQSVDNILSLIDGENELQFVGILDKYQNTKTSALDFYEKLIYFYKNSTDVYQFKESFFDYTKKLRFSFYRLNENQQKETVKTLMAIFNQYRILTASHLSVCGDDLINEYIAKHHQKDISPNKRQDYEWYHGRPVMVLKNRYDLGLYNGDIGICLQNGKSAKELMVYFDGETVKSFNISMLDGDIVATAYAMTIHKSQGSEFDTVAVVFNEENTRLLSKELIYTAVTRAKRAVQIYSTPNALTQAINTPTVRHTGLAVLG